MTMLGFDRTQIAKWVNWIGYLFALLGGCATREASFGAKIDKWGHAHDVLVWVVPVVMLIAAIYDLCDGVPNVFAMTVALLWPSFMHPLGDENVGGVVGWAIDWPFAALNDYLAGHLEWLIGTAGAGGLANLS